MRLKRNIVLCLLISFYGKPVIAKNDGPVPGCDPHIKRALDQAALYGVQRSTNIVHQSYSRPESILDLSCLEKYMNGLSGFNFLFDPSHLLSQLMDMVRNQICDHADRMWERAQRKTPSLTPDHVFGDIPGVGLKQTDYQLGKNPIKADIHVPRPDVDVRLPKVLGKEMPSSGLKDLLR